MILLHRYGFLAELFGLGSQSNGRDEVERITDGNRERVCPLKEHLISKLSSYTTG